MPDTRAAVGPPRCRVHRWETYDGTERDVKEEQGGRAQLLGRVKYVVWVLVWAELLAGAGSGGERGGHKAQFQFVTSVWLLSSQGTM